MKRLLSLLTGCAALALFACAPALATDLTITAANVVPSSSALIKEATAGATIAAGQLVYLDTADLDARGIGKAKLTDCDSATALIRTCAGMAINSASSGQRVNYVEFDPALTIGGSQTANTILIASPTAGGVAPAADLSTGEYLLVLGVVKTTTVIYFRAPGLASGVAQ